MPPTASRILVVDDESDLRSLYELTLLREGYQVDSAEDVGQARELLGAHRFDAVITDMRLPDGSGLDLLRELQNGQRPERCIVITAYGSAENAVESLKAGAFDYLTKPVDLKQFRGVIASALQQAARSVPVALRAAGQAGAEAAQAGAISDAEQPEALRRMIGQSPAMQQVKQRIRKVATSMAPVLIRGESGTGKELAARALHECSHRADGPFVAVNCGAIPETLLEAEFFGARKGSYTGSVADRPGYFQTARGGTLFLDEVGDLPLAMQSKLLRAIQERSVRAIGSASEELVDVRIVSATHKDLKREVEAGRFRQDLYYRLNVIEVSMPALRSRPEDLPELCQALIERIAQESRMPVKALSPQAMSWLSSHSFVGNVRELENLLYRAVALTEGGELQIDASVADSTLPSGADGERSPPVVPPDLQAFLDEQERAILLKVLQDYRYNRTAAAGRLGISLRQIRYRIERLNIPIPKGHEDHEAG